MRSFIQKIFAAMAVAHPAALWRRLGFSGRPKVTTETAKTPDWTDAVPRSTGGILLFASAVMAVFILGAGVWATTSQLAGAEIAVGTVVADGRNITVQHLEGGIVREIAIEEGDRVRAGQTLIRLSGVDARAQLNRLLGQQAALDARIVRLGAERDDAKAWPGAPDGLKPLQREKYAHQKDEFLTRLRRHEAELNILDQRIKALGQSLNGLQGQQTAIESQLNVVSDEVERKLRLLNQQLTNRSEYTNLLRAQAQLVGQRADIESQISRTRIEVIEARQQVERAITQRVETALAELFADRQQLQDLNEQAESARDTLERVVIQSPVDGIIVNLAPNASGDVVAAGEPIATLLPLNTPLVVSAQVSSASIDAIFVGQNVNLVLSTLDRSEAPELPGVVEFVSADAMLEQDAPEPTYTVRISLPDELPEGLEREDVVPGMTVEVYFVRRSRTFVEYIAKPFEKSLRRAFLEE
jgi:HlyD family secretion protein